MYGQILVDDMLLEVQYDAEALFPAFTTTVHGEQVSATSVSNLRKKIHDALQPARSEIPEPDAGTIIAFTKRYPGALQAYDYVALRAQNGLWYRTGGSTVRMAPMGWTELLDFIGDGGLRIATAWATVR
jgi:hypothetical protein